MSEAEQTKTTDIAEMTFEAALKELEEIVRRLEGGDSTLDDAISIYERGVALKSHCEAKLREAKSRVERITLGPDGAVGSEPADLT